jgi:hypothetical protein
MPRLVGSPVLIVVACSALAACSRSPGAAEGAVATTAVSRSTTEAPPVPHGDHNPHFGGTVYMRGDLHFEVVLDPRGTHRVYFSDAVRADLPASIASEVTLTVSGKKMPGETLRAQIDDAGESWVAKGSPLAGPDIIVRVAFVVNNDPYWIDVPYIPSTMTVSPSARAAPEYLELLAALGHRDPTSVDVASADASAPADMPVGAIRARAAALARRLEAERTLEPDVVRLQNLLSEANALANRAAELDGGVLPAARELHARFGFTAPPVSPVTASRIRARLDRLLPGNGPAAHRLAQYESRFLVGRDRLGAVVSAASDACRTQTRKHMTLPSDEALTIEYVADAPWSGYSRYQGRHRSVLRINLGFVAPIDRLLTLVCHEGYPGHHVYNTLRDQRFVAERNWIEFTGRTIFSPQGFAAETLATAAASLAFTHDERLALMRDVLFPLAGFDPAEAESYTNVMELVEALTGTVADVLPAYLDGALDRNAAVRQLQQAALMEHAAPLLTFADTYRTYATSYAAGGSLAERIRITSHTPSDRWTSLATLIAAPLPDIVATPRGR